MNKIKLYRKIYSRLAEKILIATSPPRHAEASLIYAIDDATPPSDLLIQTALTAIERAYREPIEGFDGSLSDSCFYNQYPGEHYRILQSVTRTLQPSVALEIGTATGMGSFSIFRSLDKGTLHTYDIFPWQHFPSHLCEDDFSCGKVVQHVVDLSDPVVFKEHLPILNSADLIFIDAPKDGKFEYALLPLLSLLDDKANRLLIMDDIRVVNMIDAWRGIKSPKIDLSSFGHWSGTGLVDLSKKLIFTL
jgi:predicted O-methyltransferase YrrM